MAAKCHSCQGIFILPVLFCLWLEPVRGISIQINPQYPVLGQSVTLSVSGITGNIRFFYWFKGSNIEADNQILGYFPGSSPPQTPGKQYFSRASGLPGGSLVISDLEITDRGNYTVNVQTDQSAQQASVNLTVYEYVTKPVVKSNTSPVKENDTVTLTCETANADRILWGRRRSSLPSNASLSKDNRTVTFPSIKRSDTGEYYCEAVNPVSKSSSDDITLTVNYGPDSLSVTGSLQVQEGSTLSLECSTASVPLPTYLWRHNGTELSSKQGKLTINQATPEHAGIYTCTASNSVTGITTTTDVHVTVSEQPTGTTPEALSTGTVIGIVAAAIVILALVIASIYLFVVHKARKKSVSNPNPQSKSSASVENGNPATTEGEPELQYSSINFGQRQAPKMQPAEENIIYSELRLS
ncbi:cell adhesion molecule CEACAM8-like [Pelodytes ibericus]